MRKATSQNVNGYVTDDEKENSDSNILVSFSSFSVSHSDSVSASKFSDGSSSSIRSFVNAPVSAKIATSAKDTTEEPGIGT